MRYSYELTYGNGTKAWSIQNQLFDEDTMLKAFKDNGVVKVKFHRHIPVGWHLCGCGNLVMSGNEHELCEECKSIYGHSSEEEL